MSSIATPCRRAYSKRCVIGVATCFLLLPWEPAGSHHASDRFGAAAAARARAALATLPLAIQFFRQGRHDDAARAFQGIADRLPGLEHAHTAAVLTGLGEPGKYRRVLAGVYSNVGTAHFRARRYKQATVALQTAIDVDPSAAGPKLTLALVFKHERRYSESLRAFAEAIALGSTSAKVYLDFGEVALRAGELLKARSALAHAVHLSRKEDDLQAWGTALEAELLLAEIDQAQGQSEMAEAGLRSILRRVPGEVRARYRLTQLLLRNGNVREAERHRRQFERDSETMASIQSLLAGTPGRVDALYWIAGAYARLGLLHFAEAHYLQLLAREPDDRQIRLDLHRVRAHSKREAR